MLLAPMEVVSTTFPAAQQRWNNERVCVVQLVFACTVWLHMPELCLKVSWSGRQTTSFNEFLNRDRHFASGKCPCHAGHIRAARVLSSRYFCFSTYSTPSFLHPYTFLTYCIPYSHSHSHSQTTHLSPLSLIKDCLAVRLMASFRSTRFTSSASFVVPVVSSCSTVLLAYH